MELKPLGGQLDKRDIIVMAAQLLNTTVDNVSIMPRVAMVTLEVAETVTTSDVIPQVNGKIYYLLSAIGTSGLTFYNDFSSPSDFSITGTNERPSDGCFFKRVVGGRNTTSKQKYQVLHYELSKIDSSR